MPTEKVKGGGGEMLEEEENRSISWIDNRRA